MHIQIRISMTRLVNETITVQNTLFDQKRLSLQN